MKWQEDQGLASRILADISAELDKGQVKYLEQVPHVSELIYCLTRSAYKRLRPLPSTPGEVLLFCTGLGLEEVMLRPHRKKAGGQIEGIWWSGDWMDYDEGIGEFKSTRLSAKKRPEEMPEGWTKQMLAYMYASKRTEVSLAALHLMGTYAPPFPVLKTWHGKATQEEIQANWDWLQGRKVIYLDHLERGEIPEQFMYNEDWECNYGPCAYLVICQANQALKEMRSGQ